MKNIIEGNTLSFRYLLLATCFSALTSFFNIAGSAWAADISISLKNKAVVQGPEIRLRDIGSIVSVDPKLEQKLDRMVVAKAPQPGRSRPISAEYLSLRLKQQDLPPESVLFTGSDQVQVTREGIEVSEDEIAKIVDEFLRTNRIWGDATVKVKDLQISADRSLPKGHTTYQIEPPDRMRSLSTMPLAIIFDVDGMFQKTIRANVKIEALAPVVMTAKPIGRLKPITEEDLKVEEADLANLPSGVITDIDEIIGTRARRNIQAGEYLRPDLIEMPPLVKRGDMVVIVAEAEGLKVTAIGEVKSAGRAGERVKVVNLDSNKRLSALVVDNKTVKVEF
ncbi:MAG: flagellar basal body P-ring formation chaperone FlgA [Desulfobulbia bacterium]